MTELEEELGTARAADEILKAAEEAIERLQAYIAELEAAALAVDPEKLTWFTHHNCYYSLPGGYSVLPVMAEHVGKPLMMGYRAYRGKGDDRVDLGSSPHGDTISDAQKLCERDWTTRRQGGE